MHEKVLSERILELLNDIEANPSPLLEDWVLAGDTALALREGHRVSDDLDFFRTDDLDVRVLHESLGRYGDYETLQEADHTLTVLLAGIKLSFFRVRDPFIFDGTPYRFFEIAELRDIALMKLVAISNRGSRKDFVDLYTILRHEYSLLDYFELLPRKYGSSRMNTYHILKSLTYFSDAENEPMPRMLEPFDWNECKAFFARAAHAIVLP